MIFREGEPFVGDLPDAQRVRLAVEKFTARYDIGSHIVHASNVETIVGLGFAQIVVKTLARDAGVEIKPELETEKRDKVQTKRKTRCRGSVPVGIVDHLKLAIYPAVACYIRWVKQDERYRDDGGRPHGVRFCRCLVRLLKPRRVRVQQHTLWRNVFVTRKTVRETHVSRHICPHIPVPESSYQLHASFLCEPDYRKHYLIAFARELVRWAEGKDASMYGYFDRGGNILGYAKSLCKEYR